MAEPNRAFRGPESPHAKTRRIGKRKAPKRAVNVSIDAGILGVAKDMKINLSEVLETTLSEITAEERARRFYMEHKAAIDSYNRLVERQGTLSEAFYGRDAIERDDSSI
jgi:antitoxin CcdA